MSGSRAPLRALAFALCGGAGELLLVLIASKVGSPRNTFAQALPNLALSAAPGAAVGLVDGIGFALGEARRRSRTRIPPNSRGRAGTLAGYAIIAVVVLLGCAFGFGPVTKSEPAAWFVAAAAVVVVALAHGLAGGADASSTAAGAALLGLILGAGCGFLFGLSAGLVYDVTYQPQAARIMFGPAFGLLVVLAFCTAVGVALGIVLACAQGVGRLLVPTRRAPAAAGAD